MAIAFPTCLNAKTPGENVADRGALPQDMSRMKKAACNALAGGFSLPPGPAVRLAKS